MEKNDLFERYESFLYYLMKKTYYEKDKNLNEDKYIIKLLTLRNSILREINMLNIYNETENAKKSICENCNNENLIQYCNSCSDEGIVRELN